MVCVYETTTENGGLGQRFRQNLQTFHWTRNLKYSKRSALPFQSAVTSIPHKQYSVWMLQLSRLIYSGVGWAGGTSVSIRAKVSNVT